MRQHAQWFRVVVAVAVAALLWTAGALARGPQDQGLRSSLDLAKWWHEGSEQISVTLTLDNRGDASVFLLRWQTPLDGIDADIFAVERDGIPVAYTGRLIKRAAPAPEDYVEIKPRDMLTVQFDLSSAYDMAIKGEYTVRYKVLLQDVLAADSLTSIPGVLSGPAVRRAAPGMIESNTISLWVEGREAPLTPQIPWVETMKKPGGGGGGGQFTSCTNSQQSSLLTALSNALTIAQKADADLAAYPNGSTTYVTWFGLYANSRFNTVTSHFNALVDAFQHASFTFDCSCRQKRVYAYVYANQPYKVYLCGAFWTAPNLGTDSKAGTLVHETSHFNTVASTQDYVYGTANAMNLAISDPNKAVNNADNHEYFAEFQK